MEEKRIDNAFSRIYQENLWGDPDSRSGSGSNMEQTRVIRVKIPELIARYNIRSIVDAPCGDVFWMKTLFPGMIAAGIKYTGLDIVPEIIGENLEKYAASGFAFQYADLTKGPVPHADLIITRDCFLHLSYHNILAILKNYKASGSAYLLVSTYAGRRRVNHDVDGFSVGGRALNLENAPFNFPVPLEVFEEGCTEGNYQYTDKSLALWKLSEINPGKIRMTIVVMMIRNWPGRVFSAGRQILSQQVSLAKRIVKRVLFIK